MNTLSYHHHFVAVIVIGTSKITGIVGHKEADGVLHIYMQTQVPAQDFISKGRVINMDKLVLAIKNVREKMEEQTNCKISGVYAAIECMGIRSEKNIIETFLQQRETVTQDNINSVLDQNRRSCKPEMVILDTIHLEYKLGTVVTADPIGVMTDHINATLLNLICKSENLSNIETCFQKAHVPVKRLCIAPVQLSNSVLNEQDRTAGCVFINMGSETTSVVVYKGKQLRHLAILPLGGKNITRDIAKIFNCEEDEAEELKLQYGYPNFEKNENNDAEIQLRNGGRAKKVSELYEIIDARTEEIIQNIKHQISLSGYNKDTLVNGLYIIGKTAQIPNIAQAFELQFKDWNMRFFTTPSQLLISNADKSFNAKGEYNVALSILEQGDIDCNAGELRTDEITLFTPEEMKTTNQEQEKTSTTENENQQPPLAAVQEEEEAFVPKKKKTMKKPSFWTKTKNFFTSIVQEEEEENL